MKKHLIAVAVAAAVAAPAAMADTTLYGVVHASVDYISSDTEQDDNLSISSNSSRLGVKGSEKISNGLSVIYQYEVTVNLTAEDDQDDLFGSARNSFVGLSGAFGTGLIGKHDTPMKLVGRQYDLFGDQVGDSRNLISSKIAGSPSGFDLRPDNVIAYVSPDLMGFQAIGAYVTDHNIRAAGVTDDQNPSADNNEFDAYSISLAYKHKFFDIAGAYEEHNIAETPAASAQGITDSESAWRIGAGVNYAGLRVNALYQDVSDVGFHDGWDVSIWGLGASYTFGKHVVKAQYFSADEIDRNGPDMDDGADMWAIGYDYKLSKQTTLYAAYAMTENDDEGNYYTATGGGHGDNPAVGDLGGESSAFSLGIKHKF